MQNVLVLVLLALLLQVAVGARKDEGVYLKVKPKDRTLPQVNQKLSASQWTKLTEANKPKVDDPKADPIVQPIVAGTAFSLSGISKEIVGGSLATLGQFPWQTLLFIDNTWLCGGSLILSQWVMTAAHCTGAAYDVILGTISQNTLSSGYMWLTSTVNFTHELYNDVNLNNDIALIMLDSPITFTASISPVKLPSMTDAARDLTSLLFTVSGFGRTADGSATSPDLRFTQLTVVSNAQCATYFGASIVVASTICTKQSGASTCQGDSGGPLIFKDAGTNNLWVQFGVVSFGSSLGCLQGYSGFTRVTSYLGWMSNKIGQDVSGTTTQAPTTTAASSTQTPSTIMSATSTSQSTSSSVTQTTSTPKVTTTKKTSTIKTTTTRTPKTTTTRTPKTTTTRTPKTTTTKRNKTTDRSRSRTDH
ncbi:brachyurin-like [Neocloeon triangulifer]|uniref:brachyurin-like n=1 Tax=Neocloeon triangulifer TaxID=2078957 RepID=UPI00286EB7AC|nr:brachyurin-like [Neocloeon triangulifer]